jgi:hypothetical protein
MGDSGKSAQAPTLDIGQSTALTKEQIKLLGANAGPIAQAFGDAYRTQNTRNQLYGFQNITNPGEAMGRALEAETRPLLEQATKDLGALNKVKGRTDKKTGAVTYKVGKEVLSQADYDARKAGLQGSVDKYKGDLNRARTFDPVSELKTTFADQYGMRDRLLGDMGKTIDSTSEYRRFQDALGRGITAQQADMERMQAQETGQSAIGGRLMDEAMRKMDQGGQLSPEAQREAVQSARQGFASRGMATGNAALGAELLNRDRFSRQREFENLGFAQGVEANDLARRTQNTLLRQQAGMQNAQAFNNLSQFNTLQRDATNRANMGFLGQSAALSDAERTRQLMTQQDMYNFSMSTDPRMMLAGIGSPYANMASPAASSLTSMIGMAQPQYSGGQFSSGGASGALMGGLGGAASGAMAGAPLGPYGMAAGALIGGASGAMGGSR